jgi:Plasmid pRiA4b ORF-3-like protein
MAKGTDSHKTPDGQTADLEQLTAAMSGLTQGEIENVLQRLLTARTPLAGLFEQAPPPSRRRPRRSDVVTYRIRIDLKGTKPPLWRLLELSSDLFLDQVHEIIQVAFGWTGSHLHHFGSGPGHYGPETEHYLCPFQVEEGETGVPEEDVRLDEVLVDVGDKLFYDYDFGDDWQHTIKLEAVLPRRGSRRRAVCVAGRRDGPAEDCGGLYAYELISAATDPGNPDHADAVAEFDRFYGDSVGPEDMRTARRSTGQASPCRAATRQLLPQGWR